MGRTKAIVTGTIGPANRDALILAHRLMVACEGILCPIRSLTRIPRVKKPKPQDAADQYYLLFAALAAVGEVAVLVTGKKPGRLLLPVMLKDLSARQTLVLLRTRPLPPLLLAARRARDKYFAHWDEDISEGFVGSLRGDGSDIPLVETSGSGEIATTASQWVREAWFRDLEKTLGLKTGREVVASTRKMMALLQATAYCARRAAVALIHHANLQIKWE